MKYTLALLAAAMAVQASPIALPAGITSLISPSAPPPPGCSAAYPGTFGIAAMNISTAAHKRRQISTLSDGQPQQPTGAISTISDHQPQAPTATAVSTISDHQPQAPTATAVSTISDHQPQAPTATAVSTISDHQPQAPQHTMGAITQITDGQIQGGMHTVTMMPVSQISDGQAQAPAATVTYMQITQISDGQPQAPTLPAVSTIADHQPQAPTATAVSTISDHQPQAPPATAVSTISDHQPQAPTATAAVSTISDHQPQAPTATSAVSTISDHQPQAPTSAVSEKSEGQPQAPTASPSAAPSAPATQMVACKTGSTLQITLEGGVMKDNTGRTGYIAANYQFQFDGPPQAGAIYTAGWSICGNGSLALGGSNVFYQCLSGSFYNLYNVDWAPQCSPVTIQVLDLINC